MQTIFCPTPLLLVDGSPNGQLLTVCPSTSLTACSPSQDLSLKHQHQPNAPFVRHVLNELDAPPYSPTERFLRCIIFEPIIISYGVSVTYIDRVSVVSIGRLIAFYVVLVPMELIPSEPPHFAYVNVLAKRFLVFPWGIFIVVYLDVWNVMKYHLYKMSKHVLDIYQWIQSDLSYTYVLLLLSRSYSVLINFWSASEFFTHFLTDLILLLKLPINLAIWL